MLLCLSRSNMCFKGMSLCVSILSPKLFHAEQRLQRAQLQLKEMHRAVVDAKPESE